MASESVAFNFRNQKKMKRTIDQHSHEQKPQRYQLAVPSALWLICGFVTSVCGCKDSLIVPVPSDSES
jgi:hypothetical protein